MPRARAKVRKHLGKKNPKVDVIDEWEHSDIDRDEQKVGMERRERRWKEIALTQKAQRNGQPLDVNKTVLPPSRYVLS